MLTFEPARCVRSRAVAATCRACVDACPAQALSLDEAGAVRADLGTCVRCGVCSSVCPTEAFPPVPVALGRGLRCGDGVVCVAALSTEQLLERAGHGLRILLGAAECRSHGAHGRVPGRVAQVNALLGVDLSFEDEPALPVPERRRFFESLVRVGSGVLTVDRASLDPKVLRAKVVPERRAATLQALDGRTGEVPAEAADFTSSKRLDPETCTGCQRCVTTCPTGALTSSPLKDELRFEAAKCVACGLCHDVCEPRALTRGPVVALEDLRQRVVLGRLPMRPCGECGQWFKAADGETSCPRCAAEDDEARELLGWRR